jgi:hypothetical protein
MLELEEIKDLRDSHYAQYFKEAFFIATNCFSPRWSDLGLRSVKEIVGSKADERIVTWTPPNFTAFWPVCEHFGHHGVEKLLKDGATKQDIVNAFKLGTFDPCFEVRWKEQIARLENLDLGSDLKISGFVQRNHKKEKMFFTHNHPTYNVVAWIGSQLLKRLGFESQSEEECALIQHDLNGTWNTWPETRYEFDHFGFSYPLRYKTTVCWRGEDWYHSEISKICDRIAAQ